MRAEKAAMSAEAKFAVELILRPAADTFVSAPTLLTMAGGSAVSQE